MLGTLRRRSRTLLVVATLLAAAVGCGTTRTTNTMRTATEQLLISDAVDRAVESIDFSPLAGAPIYFDEHQLTDVVDKGYLMSSMRQHLLASGCVLKDNRNEATYIVEPRSGAVGTDNHELLFGTPAVNVPQLSALSALPPAIPELPIAKRRDQRGVVKLAVFAYRRDTGEPVWQSGITQNVSTANDIWLLGAGPFQRGTIYSGIKLAGKPLIKKKAVEAEEKRTASVGDEAVFAGLRPTTTKADGEATSTDRDHSAQVAADASASPQSPPPSQAPSAPTTKRDSQVIQATAESPANPPAAAAPASSQGATQTSPSLLAPPRPLSEAPPPITLPSDLEHLKLSSASILGRRR